MSDCIFCKIINKEIPKEFSFESESLIVFPDINPAADIHLVIVPKMHIPAFSNLEKDHGQLLVEIFQVAKKLVSEYNLKENLYRVVVNGGKAQHVPHLHFHLLGGQWKKQV
ncbi:HIT domain-containing protein [Candidatus Daviesbacteria bacterium]|nr:HIT domain-containing protein [Candidatus Daviesbacteria bacterium]